MKKEDSTVPTPFDKDVIDRMSKLNAIAAPVKQAMLPRLSNHKEYISIYVDDMPEIQNWKWPRNNTKLSPLRKV